MRNLIRPMLAPTTASTSFVQRPQLLSGQQNGHPGLETFSPFDRVSADHRPAVSHGSCRARRLRSLIRSWERDKVREDRQSERTATSHVAGVHARDGPFLEQDTPNSVETDAQYNTNYKCEFWASQEASQ
jgi:hypothetical protein